MTVSATALDALYKETAPDLYKLALSMTGNPDEADDAVQETFCRAIAALKNFREDSSFSTWAYRICVNVVKDKLKQRKRLPIQIFTEDLGLRLEDIIESDPGDDPLTLALAEDIRLKCLYCFTECLPRRQRQVFCLSHVMGFDQKRIADILEISVTAVKASLFRARTRMDGYLNERCVFLKADNPCDCRQWVRFGMKRGIVRMPETQEKLERRAERVRGEIGSLLDLRKLYRSMYDARSDDFFAERLKEGVAANEWASL